MSPWATAEVGNAPPWVRRTLALSCEAVAPVSRRRGHAAAPCPALTGAAASFVSFNALFCGLLLSARMCRPRAAIPEAHARQDT